MTAYGIDFGTTNSVLARWSGHDVEVLPIDEPPAQWSTLGFDRVLPSVLAVETDGSTSFGWAAKRRHATKLEAVKRLFATEEFVEIGGRHLSVEHVASLLFGHLRTGSPGLTVDRAVVTVPANSLGLARFRTRLCAGLSGISVPALMNEPTAAAMAFARQSRRDQTVLVFDWGGGTLDVTVLEAVDGVFLERASKGARTLGGIDLDSAFVDALLAGVPPAASWTDGQRQQFRLDVELAKVRLSSRDAVPVPLPGGGVVEATRSALDRAIARLLEQARVPIAQCLADLRMGPGDIDQLVLVGGTSNIPAVRRMAAEVVGREPATGADPMTAVAEGAAIASAVLAGELDLDFFVATEHALGTVVHDDGHPRFAELIPRNHQLPARAQNEFRPEQAGQRRVAVEVIEGDPALAPEHPENVVLDTLTVDLDPGRSHQDSAFRVEYSYDLDGIVHVAVTDILTGSELRSADVTFGARRDKSDLVTIAREVRTAASTGTLGPDHTGTDHALREAVSDLRTKVIPFVDPVERARLEAVAAQAESTAGHDGESVRVELRSYSFLL